MHDAAFKQASDDERQLALVFLAALAQEPPRLDAPALFQRRHQVSDHDSSPALVSASARAFIQPLANSASSDGALAV